MRTPRQPFSLCFLPERLQEARRGPAGSQTLLSLASQDCLYTPRSLAR